MVVLLRDGRARSEQLSAVPPDQPFEPAVVLRASMAVDNVGFASYRIGVTAVCRLGDRHSERVADHVTAGVGGHHA